MNSWSGFRRAFFVLELQVPLLLVRELEIVCCERINLAEVLQLQRGTSTKRYGPYFVLDFDRANHYLHSNFWKNGITYQVSDLIFNIKFNQGFLTICKGRTHEEFTTQNFLITTKLD